MLIIYQESLHDARSTKCKISLQKLLYDMHILSMCQCEEQPFEIQILFYMNLPLILLGESYFFS